ncbi:hypothetical protein J2N86_09650 [Legionella lytica]|uniref:Uncharacterized protein n=1 Tax=Legionella lytica TaxID=96232 RepID=A0ABY4Y6V1_9GAMM|nr:hypothetical protein [Legionella lytica]USQ12965.1 hypothetical protein J2N86_09650 [Legionella lytica]
MAVTGLPFLPSQIILDGSTLNEVYRSNYISPLILGKSEIEVDYHYNQLDSAYLFILDINKPRDLIDFWNLRAIHKNVLAIPLQYMDDLSSFCREFVHESYHPLSGKYSGNTIGTICMFSRSISESDMEKIHKEYLFVNESGANSIQAWYPPIWRDQPTYTSRKTRPTLNSKTIDIMIETPTPNISFNPLLPDFTTQPIGKYDVANVIELRDYTNKNQIATVFPCNYKSSSLPDFSIHTKNILSTTEGFIFFPQFPDLSEYWDLMDCTSAINTWFNHNHIQAVVSDAGRATQQIIQALDGFNGVGSIAHKKIIELLNEISKKPITRSMQYQEFKNKVHKAIPNPSQKESVLKLLINKKAVELGLEVRCCNCKTWGWHKLNQIDYELVCELCLQQFKFPINCPSDTNYARWAYRVIGPFALPDFARGGYAASLSIRFFANLGFNRSKLTWSPGQELVLQNNCKIEADFVLWYQRQTSSSPHYPTEIIIGEAKSFGKEIFKEDDVDKMKLLAETFPGAILVFATMKEPESLSSKEIVRLKKLAEWGRSYDKERKKSRAPVIILTSIELFSSNFILQAWTEKQGQHEKLAKTYTPYIRNLRVLANVTQQLYLSLNSFEEWHEEKWKRKLTHEK